jgi:aldehyde dehydrogenase (NAD+)
MNPTRLEQMREAQRQWAREAIRERLRVIVRLRKRIASEPEELARVIPRELAGALHRTVAESMVAEVLPVLEASRFLEREAARVLKPRRIGWRGRPLWLVGVTAEIERVPLGVVLIVAAGNYPLLLADVQALQALVAGNAVVWKPAPGTEAVAERMSELLRECGLPEGLLEVVEGDADVAKSVIEAGVDHIVLTGSVRTGRAVLHQAAETLTPTTMELSGWDAVFVLPGAELERVARAVVFGMRFNGAFTCMAPRRIFLVGLAAAEADWLKDELRTRLAKLEAVEVSEAARGKLAEMVDDARASRAVIAVDGTGREDGKVGATLILQARPEMLAMRGEVFAPVLSGMRVGNAEQAVAAHGQCKYRLTASVFGPEREAKKLSRELRVGHVVVNDLIAPTADARVSFGGVGESGFGVTRGREGLLAMTRPRVTQTQRGRSLRGYEPVGEVHVGLFAGMIGAMYGSGAWARLRGMRQMSQAATELRKAELRKKEQARR